MEPSPNQPRVPVASPTQAQQLEQQTNDVLTVQSAIPGGGASGQEYGGAWVSPGAPPGQLFPTLYPQILPDGQPDQNAAHAVADTLYAGDYYANPQAFDPVGERAIYQSMSDQQIMASYLPGEMASLASEFDASGKPLPPPPGGNTDPRTGKPYNEEASVNAV